MFDLQNINFSFHGLHVVLAVAITGVTVSLVLLAITHFTRLRQKNLNALIVPLLAILSQAGSITDQIVALHQSHPEFFNGTFAAVFSAAVLYHELLGNKLYQGIVNQLSSYSKTKADAAAYRAEQTKINLQATITPDNEFTIPQ